MWVKEEMHPCITGGLFLRACCFAFPTIYFEELFPRVPLVNVYASYTIYFHFDQGCSDYVVLDICNLYF